MATLSDSPEADFLVDMEEGNLIAGLTGNDYQRPSSLTDVGPIRCHRGDRVALGQEIKPSLAGSLDDRLIGVEDAVRQPGLAQAATCDARPSLNGQRTPRAAPDRSGFQDRALLCPH